MRDLGAHPISWPMIARLEAWGVPRVVLANMATVQVFRGNRAADGWFDPDPAGRLWLAFYEEPADDLVLWQPESGALATWRRRAFALGDDNVAAAASYAFDTHLHVHADPLDWLRDGGRGIVVVDWSAAFDRLRDAPRLAVAEELLPTYRKAMQPRLPDLAVITTSSARMAA